MGIIGFVAKAIGEKKQELTRHPEKSSDDDKYGRGKDFLTRYIEIVEKDSSVPPWAPVAWTFSNVIAGSDSVGSLMGTTLFHLMSYPQTMDKLYQELHSAGLSRPFSTWSEVRNLPYLDACVQEGIRMHAPFCLLFERVVPKGGITILGHFLPEGTVVGGSPYIVNRHTGWFGEDAEFWRPERWLEKDEAHKKLEQGILTFGGGRRICLGRYVGILEIRKLISFLVLSYDIRVVDRERYQVENSWFFFQSGLYATMSKRVKVEQL